MPHTIAQRVAEWSRNDEDADLDLIHELVAFLAEKRFAEYEPTRTSPHASFLFRLRDWLNAAPDESAQKILLRLVPHLFFIGSDEFHALYRDAYRRLIQPWLLGHITPNFDDPAADAVLQKAIERTWFCPITDSLNISAFCHINGIAAGPPVRPTWSSLVDLGKSAAELRAYMSRESVSRLVLLEDFVGSGAQIAPAVALANQLNVPILVLPLVVCPGGAKAGRDWQIALANVTFAACLEIREEHFIARMPHPGENDFYAKVRELVRSLDALVRGNVYDKYYGPLGFQETGGLVVLYSNTPDNTLPVIHWQSDTWSPLFPRVSRGV